MEKLSKEERSFLLAVLNSEIEDAEQRKQWNAKHSKIYDRAIALSRSIIEKLEER